MTASTAAKAATFARRVVGAVAGDWPATDHDVALLGRATMWTYIAAASVRVTPPRLCNLTEPAGGHRGQATLWLPVGDTAGVDAWQQLLVEDRGQIVTAAHLEERVYDSFDGPGTYRTYRCEVDLGDWRVSVNVKVIDGSVPA